MYLGAVVQLLLCYGMVQIKKARKIRWLCFALLAVLQMIIMYCWTVGYPFYVFHNIVIKIPVCFGLVVHGVILVIGFFLCLTEKK